MQTLDLNLASRPFKNNALLWAGHLTAILLLSAFTSWSVQTYRERARFLDQMEQNLGMTKEKFELLDRRDRKALAAIDRFDLEALGVQAARANQAIEWEAFSWTRLFNRMAEVQPYRIKMLSIRPIFRAAREERAAGDDSIRHRGIPVAVEGTAKDVEAIFELQNALLASPYFGSVDPERLDRTQRNEYLFKLRFYYLPDAEPEAAPEPPATDDGADEVAAEVTAEAAPAEEPAAGEAAGGEGDSGGSADDDRKPRGAAGAEELELTQVDDAWEQQGEAAPAPRNGAPTRRAPGGERP